MRKLTLLGLALVSLAALPPNLPAQQRGPVRIDTVRFGFPAGKQYADAEGEWEAAPMFKAGFWTPVYVDLTAGPNGLRAGDGPYEVVVETADGDDILNNYRVPLLAMEGGETRTAVLAYTKPGSTTGDVKVSVRKVAGRELAAWKGNPPGQGPDKLLYLTVGARLPALRVALGKQDNQQNPVDQQVVAYLDSVEMMPRHWFGYQAVDLLVLATSDRKFLVDLNDERENRKAALVEWVSRGGRLLIAAGANQDVLAQIPEFQPLLPVTLTGTDPLPPGDWRWKQPGAAGTPVWPMNQPIDLAAKMEPKPDRPFQVLLSRVAPPGGTGRALVGQSVYGMGRVAVAGFDFDQRPFTTWKHQPDFWRRVVREVGPAIRDGRAQQRQPNVGYYGDGPGRDVATLLQGNLENFDEVPVISFGWVALFILLYILVVGPLDYLFLKKVVKRLELTWITFPVVVLTVSAVAYFTAYALKGSDLRINKIDLIDIDLHTQQVYGHTWFTLFSPRIQHYTVGIEPAAPDWAPPPGPEQPAGSVLVSWMTRPEAGPGGVGRSRGQGLFRRAYDYERAASGLRGVPIQVWSTKSFTASWRAPLDPQAPLFRVDERFPVRRAEADKTGRNLTGKVISGLPAGLRDAVVIYGTKVYNWADGTLVPHEEKALPTTGGPGGKGIPQWLPPLPAGQGDTWPRNRYPNPGSNVAADAIVRNLMFYDATPDARGVKPPDQVLRGLDQTWRAGHFREEVIIVARLAPLKGPAEEVTTAPVSPSRLWLGKLPGPGVTREPLAGTMNQETWVRIFLPVEPANRQNQRD